MRSTPEPWYKKFFRSTLFVVVAFGILAVIGVAYGRTFYQDYKIKQEISELEGAIGNLEHKKLESIELLSYVMSQEYIEDKARIELNLKKPGENVMVFNTNSESAGYRDALEVIGRVESEEEISNLKKWWKFFIHQ